MFGALKAIGKLTKMSSTWASITSIDPGDRGQISKKANEYMANLKMSPEDAWLMALVNWTKGMPWPKEKKLVANGIIRFVDTSAAKLDVSPTVAASARQVAHDILTE